MQLRIWRSRPAGRAFAATAGGCLMLLAQIGCGSKQSDPAPMYPEAQSSSGQAAQSEAAMPQPGGEPATAPGGETAQPAPATPGSGYSEAEVETFAAAFLEVMAVQQSFQERAATAQSPEEAQSLQTEFEAEVEQAVESEGMTMDRFQDMAEALQSDPALQQRVEAELREAQPTPAQP